MYFNYLEKADPEITASIRREIGRQESKIEMIASENFVNYEIMEAAGSALTNKYAEGYPGKRYYGGCEFVDEVETLAIERVKKIFGADHANVQPHCDFYENQHVIESSTFSGSFELYQCHQRYDKNCRQVGSSSVKRICCHRIWQINMQKGQYIACIRRPAYGDGRHCNHIL